MTELIMLDDAAEMLRHLGQPVTAVYAVYLGLDSEGGYHEVSYRDGPKARTACLRKRTEMKGKKVVGEHWYQDSWDGWCDRPVPAKVAA